ncbi:TetR/AcrR family transcriptional regulator [Sphingomonas sp. Root720]|uniref:TetR/AcrR family transcriptional regulator n=1 Tax=Sphingomonas sp. Root720 TaxID=1736595 RepID=UPI00138F1214|nr:TetR/AcrR family transcriptional regulator [Sphingomonas sp. Root720]
MPADKLNTPKGEMRRVQIREMAARIFAQKGYHGASVLDIVREMEINKPTLYHYYRSKEEILFDILTFMDEEIKTIMEDIINGDLPLFDRFRGQIAAHVTWCLSHPNVAKVAFRDWAELSDSRLQTQIARRRKYKSYLRNTVEECRAAGLIPENTNATLLLNFINGAISASNIWYDPNGEAIPEQIGIVFGAMAESLLKDLHHRVQTGSIIPSYYVDVMQKVAKQRSGKAGSTRRAAGKKV